MYFVGKIRYKKTGVTRLEGGGGETKLWKRVNI